MKLGNTPYGRLAPGFPVLFPEPFFLDGCFSVNTFSEYSENDKMKAQEQQENWNMLTKTIYIRDQLVPGYVFASFLCSNPCCICVKPSNS